MVAEKFEAMVKLGTLNSRMKDFFDIWLMSRQFNVDGPLLARAITSTFQNRKTVIEPVPVALTAAFSESPAAGTQWRAFLRRTEITNAPEEFRDVVVAIAEFLLPVVAGASAGSFDQEWVAPGPWRDRR